MNKKGFTLVELLVTVTIFSITIVAASGLFTLAIRAQRAALAHQELLNQTSYAMEYMSRAVRMAKKDTSGNCINARANYENPGSIDSKIRFLNYHNICQEFLLSDGQLGERKSIDASEENLGEFLPLTSDDFEVELLKFQLDGQEQEDNLQPRVTILISVKGKDEKAPKMKIQTSISQRDLDIQQ